MSAPRFNSMFSVPFSFAINAMKNIHSHIKVITYNNFEKTWAYAGKIIVLQRSLLNAAARSPAVVSTLGIKFPEQARVIATHSKLCSILNVPVNYVEMSSMPGKIKQSYDGQDLEGLALGIFSLSITAGDTFDAMSTVLNSGLTVAGGAPIATLASFDLPLAISLTVAGIINRSVQMIKGYNIYRNLSSFNQNTSPLELLRQFEKIFGFNEGERLATLIKSSEEKDEASINALSMKRDSLFSRLIPSGGKEAATHYSNLMKGIEADNLSHEQIGKAQRCIEIVRHHVFKKLKVDLIANVASLIALTALGMLFVGASTSLPFLIMATAMTIRILNVVYQNSNNDPKYLLTTT